MTEQQFLVALGMQIQKTADAFDITFEKYGVYEASPLYEECNKALNEFSKLLKEYLGYKE